MEETDESYSDEFDTSSLSMSGLEAKPPAPPPALERDLSFSPLPAADKGPGSLSLSATHALPATPSTSSSDSAQSVGRPLPSQSPITPSTRAVVEDDASDEEKEPEEVGASPEQSRARRNLGLVIASDDDAAPPRGPLGASTVSSIGPRGLADSAGYSPSIYDSVGTFGGGMGGAGGLDGPPFGTELGLGGGGLRASVASSAVTPGAGYGLSAIRGISSLELRTDSEGEEMHKRMFLGGGPPSLADTLAQQLGVPRDPDLSASIQMAIRGLSRAPPANASVDADPASSLEGTPSARARAADALKAATLSPTRIPKPVPRRAGAVGGAALPGARPPARTGPSPGRGRGASAGSTPPSARPSPSPAKRTLAAKPTTNPTTATASADPSPMAEKARVLREKLSGGRTANTAPGNAAGSSRPQTAPVGKPAVRPVTAAVRASAASTAGAASVSASASRLSVGDMSSLAVELHELQSRLASMQGQLARASVDASLSRTIKDGDAARELARGLAASIETLRSKLDAEASARASTAAESAALSLRHREEIKRLRESLETRLRDKQREVIALTKRVEELEGVPQAPKAKVLAAAPGPDATVVLTGDELKKLRAEIQEQEALIRGYQAENEAAVLRLKERKAGDRRREDELLETVQRLERQLREAHNEARRGGGDGGGGVTRGHLEETLKLQGDFEALREASEAEAKAYRSEIDRLKKELAEVTARAAVSLQERTAEEATMVRQLQVELSVTRDQSRALVESLERRLRAQEAATHALEGQGQLIRDQAATIAVLEHRLRQQAQAPADALAQAAARQAAAEAEAAEWRARGQAGAREHEVALRALKLQYEKKVGDLEARLAHLGQLQLQAQAEGRRRERESEGGDSPGSPQASGSPTLHPPTPSRTTSALLLAKKEHRLRELEAHLSLRDRDLAALQHRIATLEGELATARAAPAPAPVAPSADVTALQRKVEELTAQCSEMARKLAAPAESAAVPVPDSVWHRRAEAAELAVQAVQRAHTAAVERSMMLQQEHQRHLERLSEDVASRVVEARARAEDEAQLRVKAKLEEMEKALAEARDARAAAEKEAATLRAVSQGWTPEAKDYAALDRRIEAMEEERRSKELHWRQVVEEARRMHALQQTLLRQKMELALESKDREIERFRGELDGILEAAVRMQAQGAGGHAQMGGAGLMLGH